MGNSVSILIPASERDNFRVGATKTLELTIAACAQQGINIKDGQSVEGLLEKVWVCYRDTKQHAGRLWAKCEVTSIRKKPQCIEIEYKIKKNY